jgi:hypothetical protein
MIAVGGPSAATAAPAKGSLSATEFTQLTAEITGLKAAEASQHINWRRADAACRKAGTTTGLLRIQRQFCLIVNATSESQFRLQAGAAKCAPAGKTTPSTTATTTTFARQTAAEIAQLRCLNSDYQALGRAARAYYHEDQVARREALARGFTGVCFRTLSDTAEEVRHVESFAFTAEHLADDAALITKVDRGQDPAGDVNPVWVDDDVRGFAAALGELDREKPVEKLNSCPHS